MYADLSSQEHTHTHNHIHTTHNCNLKYILYLIDHSIMACSLVERMHSDIIFEKISIFKLYVIALDCILLLCKDSNDNCNTFGLFFKHLGLRQINVSLNQVRYNYTRSRHISLHYILTVAEIAL